MVNPISTTSTTSAASAANGFDPSKGINNPRNLAQFMKHIQEEKEKIDGLMRESFPGFDPATFSEETALAARVAPKLEEAVEGTITAQGNVRAAKKTAEVIDLPPYPETEKESWLGSAVRNVVTLGGLLGKKLPPPPPLEEAPAAAAVAAALPPPPPPAQSAKPAAAPPPPPPQSAKPQPPAKPPRRAKTEASAAQAAPQAGPVQHGMPTGTVKLRKTPAAAPKQAAPSVDPQLAAKLARRKQLNGE